MGAAADWAYKALTAGLGVATIYLTVTFSVNVYRGLSWHNAQTKMAKESYDDQRRSNRIVRPKSSEDG